MEDSRKWILETVAWPEETERFELLEKLIEAYRYDGKNLQTVEMMKHLVKLCCSEREIEERIFALETDYIQHTQVVGGSLLRGWEGLPQNCKQAEATGRTQKIKQTFLQEIPNDRVFSLSSVTSPIVEQHLISSPPRSTVSLSPSKYRAPASQAVSEERTTMRLSASRSRTNPGTGCRSPGNRSSKVKSCARRSAAGIKCCSITAAEGAVKRCFKASNSKNDQSTSLWNSCSTVVASPHNSNAASTEEAYGGKSAEYIAETEASAVLDAKRDLPPCDATVVDSRGLLKSCNLDRNETYDANSALPATRTPQLSSRRYNIEKSVYSAESCAGYHDTGKPRGVPFSSYYNCQTNGIIDFGSDDGRFGNAIEEQLSPTEVHSSAEGRRQRFVRNINVGSGCKNYVSGLKRQKKRR